MTDTILEAIKAAQAAPADDYMVWAEVKSGDTPHEIISHTVRLPQSMPVGNIIDHQRFLASKTLADIGFAKEEIDAAMLHITPLPSVQEVEAELRAKRAAAADLVLADLTLWEACRSRLHLTPATVNGEEEMDFGGVKIRRSAVG